MNHKRKRPKSRRRGCLYCKPHKHQRKRGGKERLPFRDRRKAEKQAAPYTCKDCGT